MNHKLAFAVLAAALIAPIAGCDPQTASPIGGGPTSTASSTGTGGQEGSTTTTTGTTTGTGGDAPQGPCEPACGAGEICVEAACHALAELDSGASDGCTIVLDDTHVYWATSEVRIVPKSGGAPAGFSAWVPQPSGLAVDDTYLYFDAGNGGLARAVKDGKSGFQPFAGEGYGRPKHTVTDGSMLYYNEDATEQQVPAIYQTPTTTPVNPTMVPTMFASNGYGIGTLAVDATSVYYWGGSGLVKEDKITHVVTGIYTPDTGLAGLPTNATGIHVDGDMVYYSMGPQVGQGGIVARADTMGGPATVLVDGSLGASGVFAIDATDVYFMTVSAIMKVAKTGGAPTVVTQLDPPSPFATCMAADDEYVYWVDGTHLMQYKK